MNEIKLLLVDANDVDRAYYRHILIELSKFSLTIIEAKNAQEALAALKKEKISCALLDHRLPDQDGIELLKIIRKSIDPSLPIILLTGHGDEDIAVHALKEGASDYLVKSTIKPLTLVHSILEAITKRQTDNAAREEQLQLRHDAYYDDLTGLLNRHAFEEMAVRALSEAKIHSRLLSLLFIDLDYFKAVNDSLGHSVGDEMLVAVSQKLTGILRKEDIIARIGGDEFAALITGVETAADTCQVAEKIIKELAKPFQLGAPTVQIGASIGIAHYTESGQSFVELLNHADIALFQAKEEGRGRFAVYQP